MCSQRWEWCLALELLMLPHLFLATSIQGHSEHLVTAISGSNVSLQISSLPANYTQLTWLYTADQKILEWESKRTSFFNSKFKERVRLNQNHALCIYNVQKEDSSTYIFRVLEEYGREKEWYISLEVHGEFGESQSRALDGPLGRFPRAHGGPLREEDRETSGQASFISPGASSSGE
nr:CD48 antigen isoform X1 [Mirounga angustirostris]